MAPLLEISTSQEVVKKPNWIIPNNAKKSQQTEKIPENTLEETLTKLKSLNNKILTLRFSNGRGFNGEYRSRIEAYQFVLQLLSYIENDQIRIATATDIAPDQEVILSIKLL